MSLIYTWHPIMSKWNYVFIDVYKLIENENLKCLSIHPVTTKIQAPLLRELPSDTSLPDELNYFYAHFEANNTETCIRALAVLEDCVIMLSVADVSKTLNRSTFTRPQGQTDYQDVCSEHALDNWQVSSLTFSTFLCLNL